MIKINGSGMHHSVVRLAIVRGGSREVSRLCSLGAIGESEGRSVWSTTNVA